MEAFTVRFDNTKLFYNLLNEGLVNYIFNCLRALFDRFANAVVIRLWAIIKDSGLFDCRIA